MFAPIPIADAAHEPIKWDLGGEGAERPQATRVLDIPLVKKTYLLVGDRGQASAVGHRAVLWAPSVVVTIMRASRATQPCADAATGFKSISTISG